MSNCLQDTLLVLPVSLLLTLKNERESADDNDYDDDDDDDDDDADDDDDNCIDDDGLSSRQVSLRAGLDCPADKCHSVQDCP